MVMKWRVGAGDSVWGRRRDSGEGLWAVVYLEFWWPAGETSDPARNLCPSWERGYGPEKGGGTEDSEEGVHQKSIGRQSPWSFGS